MAQSPTPPSIPDPTGGRSPTPVPLPPRYRFEGALGEGGLGTVVKAYDTQLRTPVAIKTIRHELAAIDQRQYTALRERFQREAIAGARPQVRSSPHIVTVYDQVVDGAGNAFLILEFAPGGTLRDRLVGGPLPVAAALRLVADAARGLQDLHDADLVHRDIKPENLFIAADGRAMVGDLGIVQMSTATSGTRLASGGDHGHPGTPLYMSPEQEMTSGMLTPEADQYSLGCVLFELVTGRRYKQVYPDEREALLGGLPAAAAVIRRMTAERPAERYRGMVAALAAVTAADPAGSPERREAEAARRVEDERTVPAQTRRQERAAERPPGRAAERGTPRANPLLAPPPAPLAPARPSATGERVARRLVVPLAVVGAIAVLLDLFILLLGPQLAPYDPVRQDLADRNVGHSAAHRLGTDQYGRDIWSRKLYGALSGVQVVPARDTGLGRVVIAFDALALAGLLWGALTRRAHPERIRMVTIAAAVILLVAVAHIIRFATWNPGFG